MRIAYITAGAAGTYCGNCIKDNALAAALRRLGHDAVLLPAYTPLLTDEEDVSERQVVFGGINLYLQDKYAAFRSMGFLDWLLDSPGLLRKASSLGVETDPASLGAMTRKTFLGEAGPYRREMRKLVRTLRKLRPEVVHLTNSMLASMALPIRRDLGVPVVCSLQGEDQFLRGLVEPHRTACHSLLRGHVPHIDRFVAPCEAQSASMADLLGEGAERIDTVLPGISLDGYRRRATRPGEQFRIGYLARIQPRAKGLELLAEACGELQARHPGRRIELHVAGWRANAHRDYLDQLARRFEFEDHGFLARDRKLEFLAALDAFSVPTTYGASKGLYVLEALAAGTPVVQPRTGVFPELLAATEGGLLCRPKDSRDLTRQLERLLLDRKRARQLGEAGRRAVLARFHAERMAAETVAVYERVLAGGGSAAQNTDSRSANRSSVRKRA